MASYSKHIGIGSLTGITFGFICYWTYGINLIQAIAVATVAEIGSILPDIDSDTSRPRQIVLGILGITIPTILACNYVKSNSLENTFCIVLFSYLIIQHVLPPVFAKYTSHRGLYHSIPMGILFSEWIYLLFSESGRKVALIYAGACLAGYLSHLILDELSSDSGMLNCFLQNFGVCIGCFSIGKGHLTGKFAKKSHFFRKTFPEWTQNVHSTVVY